LAIILSESAPFNQYPRRFCVFAPFLCRLIDWRRLLTETINMSFSGKTGHNGPALSFSQKRKKPHTLLVAGYGAWMLLGAIG